MQKQKNQLSKGNNIPIFFLFGKKFGSAFWVRILIAESGILKYYFKALEIQLVIIFSKWNQRNLSISNFVLTIHSAWSQKRKFVLKYFLILIWTNGKNNLKNFDKSMKVWIKQ